jgi:hypothetical protein
MYYSSTKSGAKSSEKTLNDNPNQKPNNQKKGSKKLKFNPVIGDKFQSEIESARINFVSNNIPLPCPPNN